MTIKIGETALVTCDNWFLAPDGRQYRSVFGTLKGVRTAEEALGVKVSARSQNWYLEIGDMVIAGCQIHYALRTNDCNECRADNYTVSPEHGLKEFQQPSSIYNADRSGL